MEIRPRQRFTAAAIGVSAGGLNALSRILPLLDRDLALSVLVVQHLRPDSDSYLVHHLARLSAIRVKEAEDKETIEPGTVYIARPTITCWSRPTTPSACQPKSGFTSPGPPST